MKFQAIKNLEPTPTTLKIPPRPLWMSPKSIRMIDTQADLRRNTIHNRNVVRVLTKDVRRSLLVDYQKQSEEAVTVIGECLDPVAGETDPHGVYAILKF